MPLRAGADLQPLVTNSKKSKWKVGQLLPAPSLGTFKPHETKFKRSGPRKTLLAKYQGLMLVVLFFLVFFLLFNEFNGGLPGSALKTDKMNSEQLEDSILLKFRDLHTELKTATAHIDFNGHQLEQFAENQQRSIQISKQALDAACEQLRSREEQKDAWNRVCNHNKKKEVAVPKEGKLDLARREKFEKEEKGQVCGPIPSELSDKVEKPIPKHMQLLYNCGPGQMGNDCNEYLVDKFQHKSIAYVTLFNSHCRRVARKAFIRNILKQYRNVNTPEVEFNVKGYHQTPGKLLLQLTSAVAWSIWKGKKVRIIDNKSWRWTKINRECIGKSFHCLVDNLMDYTEHYPEECDLEIEKANIHWDQLMKNSNHSSMSVLIGAVTELMTMPTKWIKDISKEHIVHKNKDLDCGHGAAVSIHIRRGDSCDRWLDKIETPNEPWNWWWSGKRARPCYKTKVYFDALVKLRDYYHKNKLPDICKVYVASDDSKAIKELTNMSDEFHWIYHDFDTAYLQREEEEDAWLDQREDFNPMMAPSMIADLALLKQGNAFIGTVDSAMSRLIYNTMLGKVGNHIPPFTSLDGHSLCCDFWEDCRWCKRKIKPIGRCFFDIAKAAMKPPFRDTFFTSAEYQERFGKGLPKREDPDFVDDGKQINYPTTPGYVKKESIRSAELGYVKKKGLHKAEHQL